MSLYFCTNQIYHRQHQKSQGHIQLTVSLVRLYWISLKAGILSFLGLVGIRFQKIQHPVVGCIQFNNPCYVAKYVQLHESYLEYAYIADNILDLKAIKASATISLTRENTELFESLDVIVTKCTIQEEKKWCNL